MRAVIFDMDGVLCASEPFIAEAACRMFEQTHGLRVGHADFAPFVGMGEDRFLGGVAERHGVHLVMPRDKQRTYEIYLELIRGQLQPLPGVVEFIAACRARGLRLAVATSADQVKLEGNLREIGLPPARFDALVSGNEVVRKKPAPEIFQVAAARLQVPPAQCLVVEDALSGVQAAKAAGSRCLGLTTTFTASGLRQAGADWVLADLQTVPAEVWDA